MVTAVPLVHRLQFPTYPMCSYWHRDTTDSSILSLCIPHPGPVLLCAIEPRLPRVEDAGLEVLQAKACVLPQTLEQPSQM